MSKRRVLALLVVLALSLSIAAVPAGSATLQRTGVTGRTESVTSAPIEKDGDGEDVDGGDDDRWGNTSNITGGSDEVGSPNDDDEDDVNASSLRRVNGQRTLSIGLAMFFDLLVILL